MTSLRRTLAVTSCVILTAAGLTAAQIPGPAGASTGYREYVALGDSWSADVFTTLPPTTVSTPIGCAQSSTDYPHQVTHALKIATFRDATCGSATTVDMTKPQSVPLGVNAPQFNRLSPSTDLVTLGIGGNDVGIAAALETCLNLLPASIGLPAPLGGPCKDKFTAGGRDQLATAVTATAPKIATVIAQIRQRSPHARILLVNYLDGLPVNGVGCWPIIPIDNVDVAYLQATFLKMNAMLASVAAASHVQLVDTYTPTIGHDACEPPTVRYIEGLIPVSVRNPLLLAFPFHPNEAGAVAQTAIVLTAIAHPSA